MRGMNVGEKLRSGGGWEIEEIRSAQLPLTGFNFFQSRGSKSDQQLRYLDSKFFWVSWIHATPIY
jgi:hypothetical protein